MFPRVLILPALLLVAACDGKPREPAPDVLKSQRQMLNKAKDVEQVLQQSADRQREEVEQQK